MKSIGIYNAYNDFEPPKDAVFVNNVARRPNKTHLKSWLSKLPQNTAILCANDLRAYHVMQICLSMGRAVPQDIAILGVDNDTIMCLCTPVKLSSIDPNAFGVGYAAARLMKGVLDAPSHSKRRKVFRVRPGELHERDSSAIYPIDPPWLAAALSHLDANLNSPIQSNDLAKVAGVSQTTLQKAFHKVFGVSAGKYILDVKMRRAKDLLATDGIWIKEVATAMGFSSPSHFCRAFKQYFGHPPSIGGDKA